MKIIFRNLKDNPKTLIRRSGYGEHYDARSGETSYHRRLDRTVFPKFHVYLNEQADGVEVSLHLDQKQPSYGEGHMHSGEYGGAAVENELRRIKDIFEAAAPPEPEEPPKRKGFFAKLFG